MVIELKKKLADLKLTVSAFDNVTCHLLSGFVYLNVMSTVASQYCN